jgi:hypothetical protein
MSVPDEIFEMFQIETEKLHNLINSIISISDLPLSEIVKLYYQIINISSMVTMLKQQNSENLTHQKILETETFISKKFDLDIHLQIMKKLENSIRDTVTHLQSINPKEKSKDDVEKEAKLYDELRQKMSTKEFVEQYDQGLLND